MAITGDIFRQSITEMLAESPSGAPELHVLAVDDSLVDRKVIERLLKISSCKVTVVESGTRALQYLGLEGENGSLGFDSVKVNLIMTDYSMPGMTGYELLKKIKESSVFREIPVVIMSSENVLTRIDRCLEEGAEDFLLKPVKLSDVRRLKDFIMKGKVKEGEKISHKRMRSIDCSPPLTATCSLLSLPCDPSPSLLSPLSTKKARL
ncbi:hypothetical protein AAZX31_17G091100 [Glycine max]|uniref:Response regulatory domain-containing protein n=2 Tax=Glycine subgen. Soja TaxID=1462606 RepID=I1MTM1_SOYBN|nr:two-component response regulator ARR5 isoform X2 [Glycine max]XP_028211494.1 two-component response regulator ARR5-like isoform X2 [Glycine soja]KAH1117640.1 hypothetical protein GYH30_046757 [Glycine max]KAH1201675.1 Two-component response regulator ARR5 [Glycine max]KRH03377.1 hypothetical protein GLYMA_17G093900v4 [Glycine max]RZB56060.1 Two-component response regulator ARR5 isoform B [Glycine soja]|eukprot:XP_003549646.1 two-component response regulator ARR5 isoform X2 [Glycine max]